MVPETISNITTWIMAPSDMVINGDSCNVQMFNETVKCQMWSFNETYYGNTRATQVIEEKTNCTIFFRNARGSNTCDIITLIIIFNDIFIHICILYSYTVTPN